MIISEVQRIQLRETLYNLTLGTHNSHGGSYRDLNECTHIWCIRGNNALKIIDK